MKAGRREHCLVGIVVQLWCVHAGKNQQVLRQLVCASCTSCAAGVAMLCACAQRHISSTRDQALESWTLQHSGPEKRCACLTLHVLEAVIYSLW